MSSPIGQGIAHRRSKTRSRATQIGFHRTSDRTIEFFAQREVLAQGGRSPVTVSALATVDGTNNFRDSYSPALGAAISRTVREHAAFYLEPVWVNNSNNLPSEVVDHNDGVLLGVGARIRIRPTVYLTLEGVPRVGAVAPIAGTTNDDPGFDAGVLVIRP